MTRSLLVDGHVHFHSCFSWDVFLEFVARNFSAARRVRGLGPESPGCLLFTEAAGANAYQSILHRGCLNGAPGWRIARADEDSILLAREDGETIIVVPGRQVVTAERLEVLSVGSVTSYPEGQPIRTVLQSAARHGAVAVVPWGFGKWWGRRGRIVRTLMDVHHDVPFCVGDNGGRGRWLPRPPLFQTAIDFGIPVLGGSDPLPLPSHVTRAGSYGFVLDDWCETSRPAGAIKDRLRSLTRSPESFGHLSSTSAMVRCQLGLRWQRLRTPSQIS